MSRYNRHPPPPLPGLSDVKAEHIDDEESNASLIAQTLNADGTPKRPMNAFMIFARRRRPQVSAENQSMRTGEISKLLSKEWNTMLPELKQFYIDRAKELKDTFNASYPDYVYRRRPNNSRRRRPRSADAATVHTDSPPSDEEDVKSEDNYLVYSSNDSRRHDPTHSPTAHSYDATSYNPRPSQTGPSPRISPIVTSGYPGSSYYPASSGANPPYPESTSSNWSHSRGERGNSSWNTDRNPPPYPSSAGPGATWTSSTSATRTSATSPYSFPSLTHSSYYPPATNSTSPGTGAGSDTSSPVYRDRPTTSSSASPPPYSTYFSSGGRDNTTAGDSGGVSSFAPPYSSSRPASSATDVRGGALHGRGLPSLSDQFSSTNGYSDSHRR